MCIRDSLNPGTRAYASTGAKRVAVACQDARALAAIAAPFENRRRVLQGKILPKALYGAAVAPQPA
eukprot:1723014-Alexandrium_andersonii.AAC.1